MSEPIITGLMFLPDGMDPDDDESNNFAVHVEWRGTGRYRVRTTGMKELSRAGNWYFSPERFRRHQYRFTLDEAMGWAAKVVNDVRVNGATWTQRQQR